MLEMSWVCVCAGHVLQAPMFNNLDAKMNEYEANDTLAGAKKNLEEFMPDGVAVDAYVFKVMLNLCFPNMRSLRMKSLRIKITMMNQIQISTF